MGEMDVGCAGPGCSVGGCVVIDPLTQASIDLQPFNDFGVRSCGCETLRTGKTRICQYHQGFEDGIEACQRGIGE